MSNLGLRQKLRLTSDMQLAILVSTQASLEVFLVYFLLWFFFCFTGLKSRDMCKIEHLIFLALYQVLLLKKMNALVHC